MGFEFRILGPLEVVHDGHVVRLGGRKQRTLLALLVLEAGEPISPDRLIEAIWPEYDTAAPARLQVYVSQLRKLLGDPGVVEMRSSGYALAVASEAVDAARFERLADEGREALAAGESELAAQTLRDALALWRGPALDDLAHEPFAQAAVRTLEDLRLGAREDRIEADLALGRHREVVTELEELVIEQPLRERLRGALMLALYRCGRQAEALEAYLAARRTLVDELGVEPHAELRDLHQAILRQDEGLLVDPAEVRARRHLPAPATSLVGRRTQLDELVELLGREGVRLVTLTGPGGTGKTRLALQAGTELAERFEHGVYFAGLATEEDPELVPGAIADALAIEEHPDQPIVETLGERLRDRRLLIVLDNFEHVDSAAPVVSRLLEAAPELKVLATSRSPLRLYGEHEYPVPPLALPEPGRPADSEAVDLFVVRAQAARHGFALGADSAEAVGEICARLDGLPLAIELAAARSRALSPREMLASLPRRLELAAGGPRDVPERQQTLRATLDWSYRLLEARERELFARLGVFVGGCGEAAAREVCSADPAELAALAEQSLLVRGEDGAGARRFDMLESVREYALDRLAEGGDEDRVRERHAGHYTALAEAAEPELTAHPQGTWLYRLDEEHANLRAALAWCGRSGELELELRLAGALARFWAVRGHLQEGRAWLDGALGHGDGQPPGLRANALAGAASLALRQGDYQRLKEFAGESLSLCESAGDRRGMAQALDRLATAAANEGDHARGMELYERSVALSRELGDDGGLAVSTTNLGCLALMQGDFDRATALSHEGLGLHRSLGQRDAMLQPLFNLGVAALLQARHTDALGLFRDGLELALELGYVEGLVYFLEGQAGVHAARGEGEHAATLLGAAEAAAEQTGVSLEPFERELHERTVESTRRALGDAAFAAALAAGRELGPHDAGAHAIALCRPAQSTESEHPGGGAAYHRPMPYEADG